MDLYDTQRGTLTLDTLARADLELPLGGHDLGVGAGDLDAGVQAGLEVSLDDISAVDLAGTDTTVVRALGAGEATHGPAVRAVMHVEEGVLLLETEPWLLLLVGLHELVALISVVEGVGSAIGVPALADHQDVGCQAEGVRVDGHGAKVDVGVVTRRLSSGRTVEVPFWEVFDGELSAGRDLGESLREG